MTDLKEHVSKVSLDKHFLVDLSFDCLKEGDKTLDLSCNSQINRKERTVMTLLRLTAGTDVRLKASYCGIFFYNEATTDDEIRGFARGNAPAILFPFLRAVVSMITLMTDTHPLVLPAICFSKFPVEVSETEE